MLINGIVKEFTNTVSRVIRVYRKSDGRFLTQITSGTDGLFSFEISSGNYFIICFDDDIEPNYDPIIYDLVVL